MKPNHRKKFGLAIMANVSAFLVLVTSLHAAQPSYNPVDQLMSELALGRYGGFMFFAFLFLAVALFLVPIVLQDAALLLRVLFALASTLFFGAGVFTLANYPTVHIVCVAIAFVLSVLAIYLFPRLAGLTAAHLPRSISWPLAAGVTVSIALGNSVLPIGIGQRLAAFCLLTWLFIFGLRLYREDALK
jgi:hypothetical protein